MEESLSASDQEGKLYYRSDVEYEMSWIKRSNVDVHAILALVAVSFGFIAVRLGCFAWSVLQGRYKASQKLKSA